MNDEIDKINNKFQQEELIFLMLVVFVALVACITFLISENPKVYKSEEISVSYDEENEIYNIEIIQTQKHIKVKPENVIVVINLNQITTTKYEIHHIEYTLKGKKLYCELKT